MFKNLNGAWFTFFIQDAKIDPSTQTIKTCGFELRILSQWEGKLSEPIKKAMTVLNSHAPLLMMDEEPLGPAVRVFNYKHITRLVMNGTAAADQNPSYVVIETRYSAKLAEFLKSKFPNDRKLVLEHVASGRGEGVVIMDASSEDILDKQLIKFLSEDSEFRSRSPLSICIIESFISTPEDASAKKMNETIVRVANLVIQDNKKIKFHPVDASRCFEDQKSHQDKSTVGIVKLGKYNDGRLEVFSDKQLTLIFITIIVFHLITNLKPL